MDFEKEKIKKEEKESRIVGEIDVPTEHRASLKAPDFDLEEESKEKEEKSDKKKD